MRKIFVSLAAVAAVASAAPAFAKAGPYVGVAVTHDNLSGSGDAEGIGFGGIGGSVFAGYNLPVGNNVFAGVEANFDLASADLGDKIDGIKADHQFGASVRLGYNLSESAALYGRVGYQRGRASTYIDGDKFSASRDGLRLGAGLEANVTQNVSIRLEYNRTHFYRDKAVDPANTGIDNNQASLGVAYNF